MAWIFFAFTAFAANAEVFDFDDPDLSSWYTDRFDPATFEAAEFDGDNRLHIGISGEDSQSDSFDNYQGKKKDFGDNPYDYSIVGDLYVGSDWGTGDWNVGMWGTLKDEDGNVSGYPIVSYRNSDDVDAGFYGFDYVNGGWFDLMDVNDFGQWYSFEMAYDQLGLSYYINGQKSGGFADTFEHDEIANIILNSYNFGEDYDVYWDNVGTRQPIPEPGTIFLVALGVSGLVGYRKKLGK